MPLVLSVEGPAWMDKGLWSTHRVLGVYDTKEQALKHDEMDSMGDEDVVLVTNTTTGEVKRISTPLNAPAGS